MSLLLLLFVFLLLYTVSCNWYQLLGVSTLPPDIHTTNVRDSVFIALCVLVLRLFLLWRQLCEGVRGHSVDRGWKGSTQ